MNTKYYSVATCYFLLILLDRLKYLNRDSPSPGDISSGDEEDSDDEGEDEIVPNPHADQAVHSFLHWPPLIGFLQSCATRHPPRRRSFYSGSYSKTSTPTCTAALLNHIICGFSHDLALEIPTKHWDLIWWAGVSGISCFGVVLANLE